MPECGVVLFHNSSCAMQAEAVLRRGGLPVRLIPTPRDLSSDCGLALRFAWSQTDRVRSMLAQARVEIAGLHALTGR